VSEADREAAKKRFGGQKSTSFSALMANASGLSPAARVAYRQMAVRAVAGLTPSNIAALRPYLVESAEVRGASVRYAGECLAEATVDIAFTIKNASTVAPTVAPRLAVENGDSGVQFKMLPLLQPGTSAVVEMTNVAMKVQSQQEAGNCYTLSAWPMFVGQVLDATATQLLVTLPKTGTPTAWLTRHPSLNPDGTARPVQCKAGEKKDICMYWWTECAPSGQCGWMGWPITACVPDGTPYGSECP
jgi:hypothetical protein